MTKYIVESIVIDADGELITAVNGQLKAENYALLKKVRDASTLRRPYCIIMPYGDEVEANLDDYWGNKIGFLSAMLQAAPGRSTILDAPQDIYAWLDEQPEEDR